MNLTEILTKERNSKYVDIFLYSIYRGSRQLTPTADVFYSRGKEVFRHNPIKSREYELYQKYQKDMYFEKFGLDEINSFACILSGFVVGVGLIPANMVATACIEGKFILTDIKDSCFKTQDSKDKTKKSIYF